MKRPLVASVVLLALASLAASTGTGFSYRKHTEWPDLPGSFCGNSLQSPIDIVTANVEEGSDLIELVFSDGWTTAVDGTLKSNGHSIQFTPDSTTATTRNHKGTYDVLQFHFHWGETEGEGSEHRIDGDQYEAEIHFVHSKQGNSDSAAADANSVVAVFCNEDENLAATGIWEQLLIDGPLPVTFDTEVDLEGITFADLLPDNREYYHYAGSLTTPLCNEVVQWFVLKEPIKIPSSVLTALRTVQEDAEGTALTKNFRGVQELNDRTVQTRPESGTCSLAGQPCHLDEE